MKCMRPIHQGKTDEACRAGKQKKRHEVDPFVHGQHIHSIDTRKRTGGCTLKFSRDKHLTYEGTSKP